MQLRAIVILEDDADDFYLLQRRLHTADVENPIVHFADGDAAIKYFERAATSPETDRPCLFITDLKPRGADGETVMKAIRGMPELKHMKVLVMSGTDDPARRTRSAALADEVHGKFPDMQTIKRMVDGACA